MASIVRTSKDILSHPFFSFALEQANAGDLSQMKRLLELVQQHLWEKVALESSRKYGQWHKANHMDIKRELRDLEPPTTLDLRLPIPPPKEIIPEPPPIQLIIPIKRPKLRMVITNQLVIDFPENRFNNLKTA